MVFALLVIGIIEALTIAFLIAGRRRVKPDGQILLTETDDKKLFQLAFDTDPNEFQAGMRVTLDVVLDSEPRS